MLYHIPCHIYNRRPARVQLGYGLAQKYISRRYRFPICCTPWKHKNTPMRGRSNMWDVTRSWALWIPHVVPACNMLQLTLTVLSCYIVTLHGRIQPFRWHLSCLQYPQLQKTTLGYWEHRPKNYNYLQYNYIIHPYVLKTDYCQCKGCNTSTVIAILMPWCQLRWIQTI